MTGVASSSFSSSSSSFSCGACKFLRRKCSNQCAFAPFFSYEEATSHFAAVHKVFGASNVSKLLLHLPMHSRSHAAITVAYEALERMRDPTYGCVAHIFALQQEVASLQKEIEILGTQIANFSSAACGGFVAAENPFLDLQVSQQLNDFVTNADGYQNELFSQLLPHQTFNSQTDAPMISEDGFGGCNPNSQERSAFDVSVLENFACYPW